MARLVDNFGQDHGAIIEVSSKDSGDPETGAYDVYTDRTRIVPPETREQPNEIVISQLERAGFVVLREEGDYEQEDYECFQVQMPSRDDERWFKVTVDKGAF